MHTIVAKTKIKATMKYLILLTLSMAISISSTGQHLNEKTLSKLDSILESSMKEKGVVGATYIIVKADSIYEPRSFGYANKANQEMLTKDHYHMFGSISKLITATLVVQLANEGKLDLDQDIREYVPYIPLDYPTSLHQLLTHTGGFEEQVLDRVRLSNQKRESLKDYLERKMPDRKSVV